MAGLWSVRFYAGGFPPSTITNLYTVPAGHVAIVRDIDALNVSSGSARLEILLAGSSAHIWVVTPPSTHDSVSWRGRQVFNAGDIIEGYGNTDTWAVMMSGYLLTAP